MAGEVKLQINGSENCGDGAPEVRGVFCAKLLIFWEFSKTWNARSRKSAGYTESQ